MYKYTHRYSVFNVHAYKAASNGTALPSNSELQEVIKKMYAENADSLDEITTIKISNQVSIGIWHTI